jgi:phosphinothricin acetyltransferase
VHENHRGAGLGKLLLEELIRVAREQGKHALIAAIDADNSASIAIHVKRGFSLVGTLPEVGFKFGRWLNLVFYQLTLDTPAHPVDG